VVVAIVRKVPEGAATRGNPPAIDLEIVEVLRGDYKAGDVARAVWHPPPHDIDTGGRNAELTRWSETPMEKPKVGEKFILFGYRMTEEKQTVYHVRTEVNRPASDENKAQTVKIVEEMKRQVREEADRRALEAQRLADALRKWREGLTPERLTAMARAADVIVVGQIETQMIARQPLIYVRPDKVLKQPGDVGKLRTLILPVPPELLEVLKRDSSYVLFIKWPGKAGVPGQFEVEPASGQGIALGDEKTLAVVGEAVEKK
jgi:hypothetical protein